MSRAEVRLFTEADRGELLSLFGRAGQGAPTSSLWGHPESEAAVYLTPYMDYEPESLFVAVADGRLLGYLTGSLGRSVPSEDQRLLHTIFGHGLWRRPAALGFLARAAADSLLDTVRRSPRSGELHDARWPAHLHINVAPEARSTGTAAALMSRWFDRLHATHTPGCYLQTLVENQRAVRFFERMGFQTHGSSPLVPGLRHHGRRVHQLTMVRSTPLAPRARP